MTSGDRRIDYKRIRRESRAIVRLHSSYFTELCSVSKVIVKAWARMLGLVQAPGLYKDLDLERGKYEGGFKVWECTSDLIKFITHDQNVMANLLERERTLRVLELGAGSGLASLALISRLVYDRDFKAEFRIHLQDYNWEVLSSLTLINFAINLPRNYLEALLKTKSLRFFFGDWNNFRKKSPCKYDFIMMSEVLYNADNFESLHSVLDNHLATNGYIVIATKNTYFGLTGGLLAWLDHVELKKVFHTYNIISITHTNIPRSILILKRADTQ